MGSLASTKTPFLRKAGKTWQLIVDNRPYLVLGGELQNSSFTSAQYMETVWADLVAANLNTVLGCSTWEQIEPHEGEFNFEELDEVICAARRHGLRLILLWFGSFKNGVSTYVPNWVKQDPLRFPRAVIGTAEEVGDVLSVFGTEAPKADAKAFRALMNYLREVDEEHATVLMVQVENEVGLLGDSRDRSCLADRAWEQPIPQELLDAIHSEWDSMNSEFRSIYKSLSPKAKKPAYTWREVAQDSLRAHELFMAYHYAKYVEKVASTGKEAYPLPLYTNVWQNYTSGCDEEAPAIVAGGGSPGDYPCGGGVSNVLDIWQIFAPTLSMVCPDIYMNDYLLVCKEYTHREQPLFIPEQRRDEYGARRVWSAIGSFGCIGTAPFGIDTLKLDSNPFRRHYGLLKSISKHVLEAQQDGRIFGFFFDELPETGNLGEASQHRVSFGDWNLTIERSFVFGRPSPGSGIVVHLAENRFLLVGWGFQVKFASPGAVFTGLLRFEEMIPNKDGSLKTGRMLNGDETRGGKVAIMPSEDPDYGGFPISITIPARTALAVAEPYKLMQTDLDGNT